MSTRIAINGFGRTGRAMFRSAHERGAHLEWVAINDVMDGETLAHLLRRDSVYGPFPGESRRAGRRSSSTARDPGRTAERTPPTLPWEARRRRRDGVDRPLPRPRGRGQASRGGRRKVIVSAPAKEPDVTVALGVNFDAPTTPSATTSLQRVVHDELPGPRGQGAPRGVRDPPRRDDHGTRLHGRPAAARRAAQGPPPRAQRPRQPRPDSTGAAKAIGLVIPELAGRLRGFAVRVPLPTARSSTSPSRSSARPPRRPSTTRCASAPTRRAHGILAYSEDPLVSSDIIGRRTRRSSTPGSRASSTARRSR